MKQRVRFAVLAACGLYSCALTSKSEPWTGRYFTPESAEGPATDPPLHPPDAAAPRLRLGSVSAGAHLDERIVYRSSARELGYYDDLLWTEKPAVYLRRSLARTLFEERGLQRVLSGAAPTLQVELLAFEEIRGARDTARLEAVVALYDAQQSRLQQTIRVERPIAGPKGEPRPAAIAEALAECLHAAVERIADLTLAALRSQALP